MEVHGPAPRFAVRRRQGEWAKAVAHTTSPHFQFAVGMWRRYTAPQTPFFTELQWQRERFI
jgi:hypothetical protein